MFLFTTIITAFAKICVNFFLAENLYPLCYTDLIKTKRRIEMLSKKAIVQVLFLLAAVMMIGYGAWRGEAGTVLTKAIRLCMGCVGIG